MIFGTSLFNAPWRDIALQGFVQGLLTAVISTCLYGRAVSLLGASNGSAFAALAPAMTALVAIPLLGEWPATSDWIAMVLISGGVYIASGGPLPARWAGTREGPIMPIRTLTEAISHYGREACLLTVAKDGPHTSHVTIELRGSSIGCAVGASAAKNIVREPNVSLFWPPTSPAAMP